MISTSFAPVIRIIRKNRYFGSENFQTLKTEVAAVVAEHNDVVNYVKEIRSRGSFACKLSATRALIRSST